MIAVSLVTDFGHSMPSSPKGARRPEAVVDIVLKAAQCNCLILRHQFISSDAAR